jgi:hypothetical protein
LLLGGRHLHEDALAKGFHLRHQEAQRACDIALTAIELELRWSNASGRSLKHSWVGVYAYDMELLGGRYVLQVWRSANTDVAH